MSVATAKNTMRTLARQAQEVVADEAMTIAEKKQKLDLIDVDLKAAADEIEIAKRAAKYVLPDELAGDTKSAPQPEVGGTTPHPLAESFFKQFVESDGYKSTKDRTNVTFNGSVEIKAPGVPIGEGTAPSGYGLNGQGGQLVTPNFLPGIVPLLFQPLKIADLLASGSTTSPLVSYAVESAFNDNSAPVAEQGVKPLTDETFARVTEEVGKIAHLAKITNEMYADVPQLQSWLTNRLVFGVQRTEEKQLLYGTGAPGVNGLLGRAGQVAPIPLALGATAADILEAIFRQINNIRYTSFVEPDAVVINPLDWETIRLGKDSNGQYYGGGPFTGAYGNGQYTNVENVWGQRFVITTAITKGTIFLGGFQQNAQIFRRQGVTVEMTNSDTDDFQKNLITIRAEERLALAVYRPSGFAQVTIAQS